MGNKPMGSKLMGSGPMGRGPMGRGPLLLPWRSRASVMSAAALLSLFLAWGSASEAAGAAGARVTQALRIRRARISGEAAATRLLRAHVAAHRAQLLACYAAARKAHPGAMGLWAASARIDAKGRVTQVTVRPSGLAAELRSCVLKEVRAWRLGGWRLDHRVYAQLELIFQLEADPARGATIKGGLPVRVVAGAFEARLSGLRKACLGGAAPKHRVQLRVTVDFDGSVQTAGLYGRLRSRAARRCLVAALRKWTFPPPDNGHRTFVFYPLGAHGRR